MTGCPAFCASRMQARPFRRGQVHDVHGGFRRFRQLQNPVDGFGLAPGRAAPGMAHGIARRFAAQFVPQKTGDGVVFAMDGEQAARIPERGENLQQPFVIQPAVIGGVGLERGKSLRHDLGNPGKDVVVHMVGTRRARHSPCGSGRPPAPDTR